MSLLIAFLRFWQKFLIGDDVWGALIGIAGFVVTWVLVRAGIVAWWLLPVAVVSSVAFSLWRKVRAAKAKAAETSAVEARAVEARATDARASERRDEDPGRREAA